MIDSDVSLWAAVFYALAALVAVFRSGELQWFWGSIAVWFGISFLGAQLMPGVWGITHTGPLFVPHFYLTVGSIFFFINQHERNKQNSDGIVRRYTWLNAFAQSNVLMSLASLMIAGLLWNTEALAFQAVVAAALLKFYALVPIYWFVLQAVVAAVLYVRKRCIGSGARFGISAFAVTFFIQCVALVMIAREGFN